MSRKPSAETPAPERSWASLLGELAEGVTGELGERLKLLALDAAGASLSVGRALLGPPEDPGLAREVGAYLRELRELAGLTLEELTQAVALDDRGILEAVERGTATLSFELVLRLAAILARHDPVPFLLRLTRTYNPEVWRALEDFGVGRLPLHFERERRFINIYRRDDRARGLSDEAFARVLDLTRSAFDLALHFASEEERLQGAGLAPGSETGSGSG